MRFLFWVMAILLAGCGETSAPPKPDAVLDQNTSFVVVSDPADGFYPYTEIEFDFISRNFQDLFAKNGIGHFGVVARADISKRSTAIIGQGVIFGTAGEIIQSAQIESWSNGFTPPNYLFPLPSPRLVDGVVYHVKFMSTLGEVQKVRYILTGPGFTYDTGEVTDPNPHLDKQKNGVWFGVVFAGPGDWDVKFFNLKTIRK